MGLVRHIEKLLLFGDTVNIEEAQARGKRNKGGSPFESPQRIFDQ